MSLWCFECGRKFCNEFAIYQHCRDTGHQEAVECPQCDYLFDSENAQRNHENIEHPRPFPCAFCARSFGTQSSLRSHQSATHKYGCFQCAKHFNSASALDAHNNDVHPFRCLSCGEAFRTRGHLQAHLQSAAHSANAPSSPPTAPAPQTHECHKCHQVFANVPAFVEHFTNAHSQANDHTVQVQSQRLPHHPCSQCGQLFYGIASFETHLKDEHEIKCQQCPAKFSQQAELIAHQLFHKQHEQKLEPCSKCPARFAHSADLFQHHEVHNQVQHSLQLCNKCPAKFDNRADLAKHLLEGHIKKRSTPHLVCQHCKAHVDSTDELEKHLATLHNFSCRKCDKFFFTQDFLWMHLESDHPFQIPVTPGAVQPISNQKENLPSASKSPRTVPAISTIDSALETAPGQGPSPLAGSNVKCPVCADEFPHPMSMLKHIGISHPKRGLREVKNTAAHK